jgi:hypothetical protein
MTLKEKIMIGYGVWLCPHRDAIRMESSSGQGGTNVIFIILSICLRAEPNKQTAQ